MLIRSGERSSGFRVSRARARARFVSLKDAGCQSISMPIIEKARELSDDRENADGTRGGTLRRGTRNARGQRAQGITHACSVPLKRYRWTRYPRVLRNARVAHSSPVGFRRQTCAAASFRAALPDPKRPRESLKFLPASLAGSAASLLVKLTESEEEMTRRPVDCPRCARLIKFRAGTDRSIRGSRRRVDHQCGRSATPGE